MSIFNPLVVPNTIGKPYNANAKAKAQNPSVPYTIGMPYHLAKAKANKNAQNKVNAQQKKLKALQNLTAKNINPCPKNNTSKFRQNNTSKFTMNTFMEYAKKNLGKFVNMKDHDPNSNSPIQKIERDGDVITAKLGIFKTKDYTNNLDAKKAFNLKIEDNGKQYILEHIVIDPKTAVFTFKSDDKIKFTLTETDNTLEKYTVTSEVMERKKGWFSGGTRKHRKQRNKRTRRN